ncbi:hypothetical protein [Rhodospirillum sp. A1_3_36]|uniref:hypothetical protein n=1 Tax=Rhodospirillum sp. A1_3_36 TaxID=3391666 RepID=UPI0039A55EF1
MTMVVRPYAQKSIFDLETVFARSRNNANELDRLSHELSFRKTSKARTLAAKVDQSLVELAKNKHVSTSISNPEKSPGSRLALERMNDNSELGYNGGWVRNYGVFFRDAVWRSWEKAGSRRL